MKIFIVFLGLLLLNVSIMTYKADFGKYAYLCRVLDNVAFESAELISRGADVYEAQMYAEDLLEYTVSNFQNVKISKYICEVYYEGNFAVAVIRVDAENLFRFPFSHKTSIISERKLIVL